MRFDGEVSVSVDGGSMLLQGDVSGPLLFILYSSELFPIIGNHMVSYAHDTMIYAVIPRQLSRRQVMESLNRDLVAIHSLCLKWHMRLNHKKTKSKAVS